MDYLTFAELFAPYFLGSAEDRILRNTLRAMSVPLDHARFTTEDPESHSEGYEIVDRWPQTPRLVASFYGDYGYAEIHSEDFGAGRPPRNFRLAFFGSQHFAPVPVLLRAEW